MSSVFGWSSNADDDDGGFLNNQIRGIITRCTEDGTLDSFWVRSDDNWGSSMYGKGAVYLSSNGSYTLVAQSDSIEGEGTIGWLNVNIGPSSISAGNDYLLFAWGDSSTPKEMMRDSEAGEQYWFRTESYTGDYRDLDPLEPFNDPGGIWTGHGSDWTLEMFTMYTPAPALDSTPAASKIYYFPTKTTSGFVSVPITRWDEGNWDVTIESFMGGANRNTLFSNVTPGAVSELYNILGTPRFIDTTYKSSNTFVIEPQAGWGVSSVRQKRTIAVKNISDNFLTKDYFHVKIEGKRLDI